jgi:hypothetical protein
MSCTPLPFSLGHSLFIIHCGNASHIHQIRFRFQYAILGLHYDNQKDDEKCVYLETKKIHIELPFIFF